MKVAYWSQWAETIAWARRLHDEGCEVLLYLKDFPAAPRPGQGIVPLAKNLDEWIAWGKSDPETIFFFSSTGAGELADKLRAAGCFTVCGGSFMDKLEQDRGYGTKIAQQCEIKVPPTYEMATISDAIKFLQQNPVQQVGDGGWAWKPDNEIGKECTLVAETSELISGIEDVRQRFGDKQPGILQERVAGTSLMTARWWNGIDWVGPYEGTLENKKLMNDNLGPATGAEGTYVWFYQDEKPRVATELHFDRLALAFRKEQAPPGIYDLNCIADADNLWFLEWTPRLGYDSELVSQRGITSLTLFLHAIAHGKDPSSLFVTDRVYIGVHLAVPPYPNDIAVPGWKSPSLGVRIIGEDGLWAKQFVTGGNAHLQDRGLVTCDPMGTIGCAVGSALTLEGAFSETYEWLDENLKVANLMYRTDLAEVLAKDVEQLEQDGWETGI